MVDGLIISALDSEKQSPMEWPELLRACSKNCFPVEGEEIATPDKIKIQEYFKPISMVITQLEFGCLSVQTV